MLFSVWTCPERPDFKPVEGFSCSRITELNPQQKHDMGQFYRAIYGTFCSLCMPANTRYRPLCPLNMLRYSPHCLAHYRAIVGGQLINTTLRAAILYARPCLLRLSPPACMRSMPADLRALFGVKAAENQEYLILIQVVKFMWLRCICADKWLYTAVYLYFSINDKAGNN